MLACVTAAGCLATLANVLLCKDLNVVKLTSFLEPGSGRRFAKVIRGKFCKASNALPPAFFVKDMLLLLTCQR